MKIKINNLYKVSDTILKEIGFKKADRESISRNIVESELVNKSNLGLSYLLYFHRHHTQIEPFNLSRPTPLIEKSTSNTMIINGSKRTGHYVMEWALEKSFKKIKNNGLFAFGFTNTHPTIGYVSQYARKVVEKNLIFIGFANSSGRVAPYGSTTRMWGTNPITYGIPGKTTNVIYDAATSAITASEILVAKRNNTQVRKNTCIDEYGEVCVNPAQIWESGAILPFGEHKGSGLGFLVELIAGALTGSKVGNSVQGNWGVFCILIDPSAFRDINRFLEDVDTAVKEVKSAKLRKGFNEILIPGERALRFKNQNLKNGFIEVSDFTIQQLREQFKTLNQLKIFTE